MFGIFKPIGLKHLEYTSDAVKFVPFMLLHQIIHICLYNTGKQNNIKCLYFVKNKLCRNVLICIFSIVYLQQVNKQSTTLQADIGSKLCQDFERYFCSLFSLLYFKQFPYPDKSNNCEKSYHYRNWAYYKQNICSLVGLLSL